MARSLRSLQKRSWFGFHFAGSAPGGGQRSLRGSSVSRGLGSVSGPMTRFSAGSPSVSSHQAPRHSNTQADPSSTDSHSGPSLRSVNQSQSSRGRTGVGSLIFAQDQPASAV